MYDLKPAQTAAIVISFVFCPSAVRALALPVSPHIPFAFVENRGQAPPQVRFIGAGPAFKAWFEDRGVILRHGDTDVKITFQGSSSQSTHITIKADNPLGAKANFLLGSDPRQWKTDLTRFGNIHYEGVWPGVELTYRAEDDRVKAEYLVAPAAAVDRIRLRFDGASQVQRDGDLRVHRPSGDLIEEKPLLYQSIGGKRTEVPGGFRKFEDGSVGFWTADYDHSQPLIIDPSILLSGYFGGSSEDNITAVGIDNENNVVVAGWTSSNDLPASSTKYGGSVDAFVASFLPNGGALIYCTYVGGAGNDRAYGLATDSSRNVYITGSTSSTNFPVVGAIQSRLGGTQNAFVTKLNAAGSGLVYSTYLGGSGVDAGYAIALVPNNSELAANTAVVVGDTTSKNFLVTAGVFQPKLAGSQDAFVTALSPAGQLTFSTYLGGNAVDHASSVAIAQAGSIFVGGYTWSTNFPTVAAYQAHSGGGQDGFLTKLSPAGVRALFSTYIGGSGGSVGAPEEVNAVCIDPLGEPFVAGTTSSANFPVTANAFASVLGGQNDGFIAHFSNGGSLLQATFLGGSLMDSITAMTVDFSGDVYATGYTSSPDFPVQWPFQASNAGEMDAFVAKLNNTLSTLMFSTYLGGNGSDQANAIAVDAETSIVVAGQTGSTNYPVTGSLGSYLPSVLTSFITKIRPNFTLGVAYKNGSQMEFTADPWHVMSDTSSTYYGLSTDLPIVGDWTGTGINRIGIFRNGTWILDTNGDGIIDSGDQTVVFGQAGDIPVVGDWRGTGHIALGLYRQGTFILDYSGHLSGVPTGLNDVTISNFGLSTDIPIVDDWSGSGTAKVGVFRNGSWLVDYNGTGVISQTWTYGAAGDIPVVGDWDSSGNPAKIGIYRSGLWVLDYNGDHVWTTPGLTEMSLTFGFAGYTPLIF